MYTYIHNIYGLQYIIQIRNNIYEHIIHIIIYSIAKKYVKLPPRVSVCVPYTLFI